MHSLEKLTKEANELSELFTLDVSDFILSYGKVQLVLLNCFSWFLVYCVVHFFLDINLKNRKEIYDTKNRIVSCLHSSIGLGICLYDFISFQSDKFCSANSLFQNYFLSYTIGYFIYDLICCILLDIYDKEVILHHLFCILGFYIQLAVDFSGMAAVRFFIVSEITNPIMHIRIILRTYGLKLTKLYLCLELMYIIIYMIARGIFAPILVYKALFYCPNKIFVYKGCAIFILLLSFSNIKKMIAILKFRYSEMCERNRKNIQFYWFEVNKNAQEFDFKIKESIKLDSNQ